MTQPALATNVVAAKDPLEGIPTMEASTIGEFKPTVLYEGPSGTGKSFNLATWPKPIIGAYFDPNAATTKGFIEAGNDIKFYLINSWPQFTDRFVPMVKNRMFNAKTIAIEGAHHLANMMWRDIQGGKAKLTQDDFGRGKDRQMDAWRAIVDSAKFSPGQRTYNVVATTQLKKDTDESGGLLTIGPNMMGAFKDMFEGYFNSVFLCEVTVIGETVNNKIERKARWFIHTVPPTQYNTCKDSIGDLAGRRKLPAQTGGTYPELCAAWGCEPEPNGWPPSEPTKNG